MAIRPATKMAFSKVRVGPIVTNLTILGFCLQQVTEVVPRVSFTLERTDPSSSSLVTLAFLFDVLNHTYM